MLQTLASNAALVLLATGLVLMVLEAISPGAYIIVIGVALAGAGLIGTLAGGLGLFALAALTLVIGVAATWVYHEFDFYGGKGRAQTTSSSSLTGASGYVTKPVTERGGEVKLERGGFAPYYSARTSRGRIEEGTEVIVMDPGGGNVLTVEPIESVEQDEIDRALARDADASGDPARPEDSRDDDASDRTVLDEDAETERSG
ncbi:NfeD family protein [Halovivax cerinus]|uniref:NfeD family protein n=1 Tax=Halovivax cerinus TaxID=1487865 RepID=A0ABD5NJT4_9EURY|nr:NfeD family protein [Halovivax cerinus]